MRTFISHFEPMQYNWHILISVTYIQQKSYKKQQFQWSVKQKRANKTVNFACSISAFFDHVLLSQWKYVPYNKTFRRGYIEFSNVGVLYEEAPISSFCGRHKNYLESMCYFGFLVSRIVSNTILEVAHKNMYKILINNCIFSNFTK